MTEKKCSDCLEIKSLSCFNISKRGLMGRKSKCRTCVSKYNTSYHKERFTNDPEFRKKRIENAALWAKKNPEKRSAIAVRRNQKELLNSPEKVRCRALVNQRVRFGRIPKASELKCVRCGETAKHYHHHKGYSFDFRYDVVPVCLACHVILG